MTIEQLKNFVTVSQTMNFRQAAEKTYIAQPALSRQIQNLEEELGALLFDRSKRQIALTDAGHYFREEAIRILKDIEKVKDKTRRIHRGEAGSISIGHASSAMHSVIPPLLLELKQRHPALGVSLLEGSNEFVFEKLKTKEVDFGFVPNALIPSAYETVEVYRENYSLILPQHHRFNEQVFTDLSDCRDEDWILHPQEGYGYMERILQVINEFGYQPRIVHRSPNTSSVLRMVSAGLGITMMGKSTLSGFDLNLKTIELKNLPYQLDMKLVMRKDRKKELENYFTIITTCVEQLATPQYARDSRASF